MGHAGRVTILSSTTRVRYSFWPTGVPEMAMLAKQPKLE